MNVTVRTEKVDKNRVCLVAMVSSRVIVLTIFCNFSLTKVKNLSPLKQFAYKHLKSLVTRFRKMQLFIML